jgi:hypothetical protein
MTPGPSVYLRGPYDPAYKLDVLKRKAERSASFRGHALGTWETHGDTAALAYCTRCSMTVAVNAQPLPNGIDVGGEAVALTCHKDKLHD